MIISTAIPAINARQGSDAKEWRWVTLAFLIAPLLPEYIAPIVTFGVFCRFAAYMVRENRVWQKLSVHAVLFAFMIWQFFGLIRTSHILDSFAFSFLWVLMFFGFLFTLELTDSRERLEQLLFFSTLSGGIAGTIGVGQIVLFHFGGYIAEPLKTQLNPFWQIPDVLLTRFVLNTLVPQRFLNELPRQLPIDINDRANSTFSNPVFFACLLVMLLPFAVYCFFYLKDKKKKWVSLACIVMIIGGIASSYSRAPYLAVGVVVVILLCMGWKQALKIMAVTPVFLLILPSGVYKRLLTLLGSGDISVNTRADVWEACIQMLKDKWLLGFGPGVGNIREQLHNEFGILQPHAHNLFLQYFLEGGILGVLLFSALILCLTAAMIMLCIKSKSGRPFGVAVLASVAGLLICGFTDHVLYGPKILQYFMMILGLAFAGRAIFTIQEKKREE